MIFASAVVVAGCGSIRRQTETRLRSFGLKRVDTLTALPSDAAIASRMRFWRPMSKNRKMLRPLVDRLLTQNNRSAAALISRIDPRASVSTHAIAKCGVSAITAGKRSRWRFIQFTWSGRGRCLREQVDPTMPRGSNTVFYLTVTVRIELARQSG